MARDPAAVGARVLAALDAGRARAHANRQARHDAIELRVIEAASAEILADRSARGRAGRIARKLTREGLAVSRETVRKILHALSNACSSQA